MNKLNLAKNGNNNQENWNPKKVKIVEAEVQYYLTVETQYFPRKTISHYDNSKSICPRHFNSDI
jgi:hypothetical protein